jgi:hypothetical protein
MSDPRQNTTPVIINVNLLPNLSPRGAAMREPKKHPAWSSDTMFAANASDLSAEAPLSPKSLE